MLVHGLHELGAKTHVVERLSVMHVPLPVLSGWIEICAQVLGGLGSLLGLLTPLAGFVVGVNMVGAILTVHLRHGLFESVGGFEYPLALFSVAVWFMAAGGGPLSVDRIWCSRRDRRSYPTRSAFVSQARAGGDRPGALRVGAVTESGFESFPASDPPAHSRG